MTIGRFQSIRMGLLVANLVFATSAYSQDTSRLRMDMPSRQQGAEFKNWSGTVGTGVSRGLDEFSDTWISALFGEVSYTTNDRTYWSAEISYSTILYRKDGELLDNYDTRPERYGFSDTTLSYSIPKLWSADRIKIGWTNSLIAPTSNVSQKASLILGGTSVADAKYALTGRLSLTSKASLSYYQFQYDDADVYGFQVNAPFRISYGLGADLRITRWLSLAGDYSQTQRLDYESRWTPVQGTIARLKGRVGESGTLYVGYAWADRIFSNEPALSDNYSQVLAGGYLAF